MSEGFSPADLARRIAAPGKRDDGEQVLRPENLAALEFLAVVIRYFAPLARGRGIVAHQLAVCAQISHALHVERKVFGEERKFYETDGAACGINADKFREIQESVKTVLGDNVETRIETVDSLPRTPTGKHRFTVPEVH